MGIKLNQNTEEWLKWRNEGIGSSDAPIIMGVSPYSTPHKLWRQKLGLDGPTQWNPAMELGSRFEESARAQVCLETGMDFEPDCVEHQTNPKIRASLDGLCEKENMFLELKYMGQKNLEIVQQTKKPLAHHHDQIQHQFAVSGYKKSLYSVYTLNDDKSEILKLVTVEIHADEEYIATKLIPKELEFLKMIDDKLAPELMSKDILNESEVMNLALARRWRELKTQVDIRQKEIDQIEISLKKLTLTHPLVKCGNILIQQIVRKGNVNYHSIPELKNVNLEKFRKAATVYTQIKDMKEEKHASIDETEN